MKNLLVTICYLFLLFSSKNSFSNEEHTSHDSHSHETHNHEVFADGSKIKLNSQRFNNFIKDSFQLQIAIINVKGMVCEFCARGIEKTFFKDPNVKKIDVDLSSGKVLIAYKLGVKINFNEIRDNILSNGLEATSMEIVEI